MKKITGHRDDMAGKKWNALDPRVRQLIVVTAAVEGALKTAALIDLGRRPSSEIKGSKLGWVAAILLINAAGAVPVIYFRYGRRG